MMPLVTAMLKRAMVEVMRLILMTRRRSYVRSSTMEMQLIRPTYNGKQNQDKVANEDEKEASGGRRSNRTPKEVVVGLDAWYEFKEKHGDNKKKMFVRS